MPFMAPLLKIEPMDVASWNVKKTTESMTSSSTSSVKRSGDDNHDSPRPKNRIRRSMTACNTCRKLKTRCDLEPRSHACRRCLSLRIECELPEASERFQENSTVWSEASSTVPASIEERLSSLERSMLELTGMVRHIMQTSTVRSHSPVLRVPRRWGSLDGDETASEDGYRPAAHAPKPIHVITELQSEFFGEKQDFSSEANQMADIVTQGLIDAQQANRLLQIFVEHFGSWVSIQSFADLPPNVRQSDPLLFSTACLLAARYASDISLPVIHAIYRQVRRLSSTVLWSAPPLKYTSLQALTLLCLWSGTVQSESPMDSWLLSGISINHAIIAFNSLDRPLAESTMTEEGLRELRVWNALCLTQLHFAIGNARPFNLKPKYLDYCRRILDSPGVRFEDGRVVAEISLYSLVLSLQNSHYRIQQCETEYEELNQWQRDWAHLLTEDEQSTTLDLGFWFCQLLLFRTSLRFQPTSETLIAEISKRARLILSKFLRIPSHAAVHFIDHIFFVVAYAALTLCEFNYTDPILEQIQIHLIHTSANEDHLAYRFACVIGEVKRRSTNTAVSVSSPEIIKNAHYVDNSVNSAAAVPLMNTMPEGYGSLEQLLTGFVPADSVASQVYTSVPLTSAMNSNVVHPYHPSH